MIKTWLAHPLTKGLNLDDPRTTHLRRQIVQEKPFLRQVYHEWYSAIVAALPFPPGAVVELGAGGGFMSDLLAELITSEVFFCPNVTVVLDGSHLPFVTGSLRAIVMTNVLHHLHQARGFFTEAARCVRPDGVIAMIEPWATPWSRFVYTRIHHEPFRMDASSWELPISGPLSGANDALPWIIFARDRAKFEQEFPQWRIELVEPFMPFRYLISGGISLRALTPGWTFGLWRQVETALLPWNNYLAMFARITLRRLD